MAPKRPPQPTWQPNPGPQAQFLASTAYEVLYGGSAGGGKSEALLMGALRDIHHPQYRALLLRVTFPELQRSLIEKSRQWYPLVGGEYVDSKRQWRFPSGAIIEFGHLENDGDVYVYASAEYSYIGFDELTQFTERKYTFLLSRARSPAGLPICIRAATNPGGIGHEWVQARWSPWLGEPTRLKRAAPGEVLHYYNTDDGERWCPPSPASLSRQFIPARVTDNPHLMRGDPGYLERLGGLDPVTRAQLRDGDWQVRPSAGTVFRRAWFEVVPGAPRGLQRVRYWDRAASAGRGDYTVGLLLGRDPVDRIFYVIDVIRLRGTPGEVEQAILHAAFVDGGDVMVGIEQDPGSAGVFEAAHYVRSLQHRTVKTFRPTGSKIVRAQPASAQAEHGNIKVVRADWNFDFLGELERFPDGGHDDQVDALSGAVAALAEPQGEAEVFNWNRMLRGEYQRRTPERSDAPANLSPPFAPPREKPLPSAYEVVADGMFRNMAGGWQQIARGTVVRPDSFPGGIEGIAQLRLTVPLREIDDGKAAP